jgi:hypothetical protein
MTTTPLLSTPPPREEEGGGVEMEMREDPDLCADEDYVCR